MQIEEGDIGYYKIVNRRKFAENNKEYFIVEGDDGFKRLIPAEEFTSYNFIIGDKIRCRVDKINCNGRIFLEPEHPVYKSNHSYKLPIVKRIFLENCKNGIAIVKDCFSNPLFLILPKETIQQQESILCHVEKVKKGNLFLKPQIPEIPNKNREFEILEKIVFEHKSITIMEDSSGDIQYFFEDSFKSYNIEIDQIREFKAIRHNSSGNLLWEPIHPYFKIDSVYSFTFIEKKDEIDPMRGVKKYAVIKDEEGNIHKMLLNRESKNINLDLEKGEKILCKVDNIKRGKVYLDYYEDEIITED